MATAGLVIQYPLSKKESEKLNKESDRVTQITKKKERVSKRVILVETVAKRPLQ